MCVCVSQGTVVMQWKRLMSHSQDYTLYSHSLALKTDSQTNCLCMATNLKSYIKQLECSDGFKRFSSTTAAHVYGSLWPGTVISYFTSKKTHSKWLLRKLSHISSKTGQKNVCNTVLNTSLSKLFLNMLQSWSGAGVKSLTKRAREGFWGEHRADLYKTWGTVSSPAPISPQCRSHHEREATENLSDLCC